MSVAYAYTSSLGGRYLISAEITEGRMRGNPTTGRIGIHMVHHFDFGFVAFK